MSRDGVGEGSRVIFYSAGAMMLGIWAAAYSCLPLVIW
jgi:hypothetical protein